MILGFDGHCGWPTALHLAGGHDLYLIDNGLRREIDEELNTEPLFPLPPPIVRTRLLKDISEREIRYSAIDISREPGLLEEAVREFRPEVIFDFAKIRAAPYSMRDAKHSRLTLANNTPGTLNVLNTILAVDPAIHLIHIGTMGCYGYDQALVKEAVYRFQGEPARLPGLDCGSVYHFTKVADQHLLFLFAKLHGLKITEVHQGIVWGLTEKNEKYGEAAANRFDYDHDFGTVMNRFALQAACQMPLTIYGKGGQLRPFIHIDDAVLVYENLLAGDFSGLRVIHGFTETSTVNGLAELVGHWTGARAANAENLRLENGSAFFAAENAFVKNNVANPRRLDTGAKLIERLKPWTQAVNRQALAPHPSWKRT